MNEEEILELQDWIEAVLQAVEEVLQSGEEIPDEFYGQIADAIQAADERILELQEENIPPEQPPGGGAPEFQPPIGTDLLWILAGGQEDAFINYLRTYPDAGLNALLRNPALLQQTIEHLQRTIPQERNGEENGIPEAPIDSSNIYGFQYDPQSRRLLVRFQSGSVYSYTGVPNGVFNVFQNGAVPARTNGQNEHGRWWTGKQPSLGAAFYNLIRSGGYPFERLS